MYKHVKKIAFRKIAGETFIVVPATRMLYQPTGVGERIWDLIGDGLTLEEIAEKICCEYEVSYDVALNDVKSFIDDLLQSNLVTHAE